MFSTFPVLAWVLKIKPKPTAAAFSYSQTSQKQMGWSRWQGDKEEPEWTRVEAREGHGAGAEWRNDAEKSWQQSTHLGIDIRVKGAVLFEFFDLKSILQKGEEKESVMIKWMKYIKAIQSSLGPNTRTQICPLDVSQGSWWGRQSPGHLTHHSPFIQASKLNHINRF